MSASNTRQNRARLPAQSLKMDGDEYELQDKTSCP